MDGLFVNLAQLELFKGFMIPPDTEPEHQSDFGDLFR